MEDYATVYNCGYNDWILGAIFPSHIGKVVWGHKNHNVEKIAKFVYLICTAT
jgi:hypothetical protein